MIDRNFMHRFNFFMNSLYWYSYDEHRNFIH
jgi:hypothetical protein